MWGVPDTIHCLGDIKPGQLQKRNTVGLGFNPKKLLDIWKYYPKDRVAFRGEIYQARTKLNRTPNGWKYQQSRQRHFFPLLVFGLNRV